MTATIGTLASGGAKKGSAWGTPVQIGANEGINFLSEDIVPEIQVVPDEGNRGSIQEQPVDRGNIMHRGSVRADARYNQLGLLYALPFGATLGAGEQQGSDLAYRHLLTIANRVDGDFACVAFDYQEEIHEYDSCKILGFDFECNQADHVARVSFPLVARNFDKASSTNTSGTWASVTLEGGDDRLLFSQMRVQMLDQSSGNDYSTSTGDDDVHVDGITLSLRRVMKEDDFTTKDPPYIEEPLGDGRVEVRVSLSLSKMDARNDPYIADRIALTKKRLKIAFTGGVADGGTNFSWVWYLNNVQFGDSAGKPNIGGAGLTPWTLDGRAAEATSLPTGHPTGGTHALVADFINEHSADLLA